ncbi:MAG TPA: response regulator transcription factor [Solirubrobacteraceae bacterium]|jgi:two-component system nitrate/nitrite response regulator NarL|nr:response regulator transcription factor [Solirubrobacteraceae bacterium]
MAERVFLCDDDDGYRMLLREVLSAEGMHIVGEGGDGAACVEAVVESDPDVVLLDLNMPGMNGFEALPLLRAGLPEAKLIVLSTSPADRQSVSAAHMLGADGYVSKPYDIFAVPALLRRALAS